MRKAACRSRSPPAARSSPAAPAPGDRRSPGRRRRRRSPGRTPARARRRARKPMRPATRASRLGVAMPVEEMVTMVSTSRASHAGIGQRAAGGRDEEVLRAGQIGGVALRPVEVGEIPVERLHRVARADAGSFEHRRHALEGCIAVRKDAPRRRRGVRLKQPMRRHGMADGEQRRGLAGFDRHRLPLNGANVSYLGGHGACCQP